MNYLLNTFHLVLVGDITMPIPNSSASNLPTNAAGPIATAVSILFWALGLMAVVAIMVGAFQYIFSAGDSSKTTKAKDTILYAVLGIVFALLGYAIVQLILSTVR